MTDFRHADPVRKNPMSDVCSTTLFDNFANANTFKGILLSFNQICGDLGLDPLDYQNFYSRLKERLNSWKAEKLWALLDKRASQKEYRKQKACRGLRVLIIGAGPCGLRLAIECALLGCKVVVLEKRDRFSRNNVLHFWRFVIHDLQALGAKFFYPRFCAGSIDHISIRQLQCVLLKVALIFGVEIHENVAFTELVQPEYGDNFGQLYGWRANVVPEDHFVSEYEFDVLFGADGKRNTVPGFHRKEFRGKLAIAITANFINRRTEAEERVPELSGVAFIFNQQFFKDLRQATGIDLENIVYYKDDTHYFVMTAKKQSLLEKAVIKQDSDDISWLLDRRNLDQEALLAYAREAADFATEGALPRLDFALNHLGQPDVAMFDFTSLFSAEYSCRFVERLGVRLLIGIAGDSLHEPFWPTGSGCARGFLGVFDAAWMLRQYCGGDGATTIGSVLAERESAYRLLAQTTPENLSKSWQNYTIDPRTRYPRFEPSILPAQVHSLIDTDNPTNIDRPLPVLCPLWDRRLSCEVGNKNRSSLASGIGDAQISPYVRQQQLTQWYQSVVAPFRIRVDNLTVSFRSGLALLAVLRRYLPDLMAAAGGDERFYADLKSALTSTSNWNEIRSRALNAIREELGLDPPLSLNDKEAMYQYLSKLKDTLVNIEPQPLPIMAPVFGDSPSRSVISKSGRSQDGFSGVQDGRRNRRSSAAAPTIYGQESEEQRQERYKRRLQTLQRAEELFSGGDDGGKLNSPTVRYSRHRPKNVEKLTSERLKEVEQMISGKIAERKREIKPKKPTIKMHKLDQREIEEMEVKLRETGMGCLLTHPIEPTLTSKESKVIAAKTQVLKERAKDGFKERNTEKYTDFDKNLTDLNKWLQKPNLCGAVGVKELLGQHEHSIGHLAPVKKSTPPPVPPKTPLLPSPCVAPVTPVEPENSKQPLCHFCNHRVYLAEKLSVENLSFHRRCFRCAYCDAPLKLNGYGMERIEYNGFGKHFFCMQHLNLSLPEKLAKIKSIKEKQKQNQAAATPSVAQETVADFRPKPGFVEHRLEAVTTPTATNVETRVRDAIEEDLDIGHVEAVTASSSFEVLSKTRDMLSSGIFYSSNTPERAEFEVSLNRPRLADVNDGGSANGIPKTALGADEEEEFLDEEAILWHNAGDGLLSTNCARPSLGANDDAVDKASNGDKLDEFCANDEETESDDLSSDEERALTNWLDSTGGVPPSVDETVNLIHTLKTQRRVTASREDLDEGTDGLTSGQGADVFDKDSTNRSVADQSGSRLSSIPNPSILIYDNDNTTDRPPSACFTPNEKNDASVLDESCFKTSMRMENARERLMSGLEKSRAEARARARLKSDEELTLAVSNRSGARGRSSSVQLQMLSRTKSHEFVSPNVPRTSSVSHDPGALEHLHRKTYSEELATAADEASFVWPLATGDRSVKSVESAPEAKKARSFFSKLLSPFATPKVPAVSPSSVNTPIGSSESNKETNLLSKVGAKYGPNKRRSRGSLSPQQSFSGEANDVPVNESISKGAPKLNVNDLEYSDVAEKKISANATRRFENVSLAEMDTISVDSRLSIDSNVSDRDVRRVQRAAAKIVREAENKRHRQAGEIQRQLEELEVKRQNLNSDGLETEKKLQNDPKNLNLLQQWLTTVEERNRLNRYEQELLMQVRELELENQHAQLQQLYRERLAVPSDAVKSSKQLHEEQQLLEQMIYVVSQRDMLVSNLEKHKAQDFENYAPGAIAKKIESVMKQKRYDYRNFEALFTSNSNRSGNSASILPVFSDERRYSPALDSVI